MWKSLRSIFPNIRLNGCHFHYCQAIYRHVQEYGMAVAYRESERVREVVQMVFALPMLPLECVEVGFAYVQQKAEALDMEQLFSYIKKYWFGQGATAGWTPKDWVVFGVWTRTNNDLEGWHRRLNAMFANPHPNLYQCIGVLFSEAKTAKFQVSMVAHGAMSKSSTTLTVRRQKQLGALWSRLTERDITVSGFLKEARCLMPSFN